MEQRSFKEKRSPSKNSGTPKQRFKSPLFTNDEKHTTSPGHSHDQPNDIPLVAGKIRSPRTNERNHPRKSESSISGENVFQDELALYSNPKSLAHSLPNTGHGNSSGIVPRGRVSRVSEGGEGLGGNNGKGGENSPDSGSMISDDAPSGYTSADNQYDTLSAGYMSDMAGRITDTDTRMDWREPNLDIIEETRDNMGAGTASNTGGISHKSSDEEDCGDLFLVPPPPPVTANPAITGMIGVGFIGHSTANGDMHDRMIEFDRASTPSTDSNENLDIPLDMGENSSVIRSGVGFSTGGGPAGGAHHTSPINFPGAKSKLKKKVTTFAVPIEASPLSSGAGFIRNDSIENNAYMDESSDANVCIRGGGMHLSVGGYRTVPSDTDTTDAIESDGCAIATETGTDSGTDNPNSGAHRPLVKQSKQSRKELRRFRRKQENHDDEWFEAHDNKYWKATRFICFWGSIVSMLAAIVAAGIFIAFMPRDCNPEIDWYHGTVTLDINPTMSAKNTWIIDLKLLSNRLEYYHSVGIQTIHLRDISKKDRNNSTIRINNKNNDLTDMYHPTNDIIGLAKDMMNQSGNSNDPHTSFYTLKTLTESLHQLNMTLMVQIPVVGNFNESQKGELSLELQQDVSRVIQYFMQQGTDGIFLDGLEHFGSDRWAAEKVKVWRDILDQYGVTNRTRILMTSYKFAHNLEKADHGKADDALKHINLLDATLDLQTSSSKNIVEDVSLFNETSDSINDIVMWDTVKGRPWINWNLGTETFPLSNAALALQMLLPGTINIGDTEKTPHLTDLSILENVNVNNHSSAGDVFRNMTSLRAVAVPIYMNGNYKRCNCPEEENNHVKETNFLMRQPIQDVIQLERFYSRRNRFVLVANFGSTEIDLTPIGRIYSGGELVLDTSNSLPHLVNTDVQFKSVVLAPLEAIVMKLPK